MASTDSDSVLLNQIIDQGVNIYGSRERIRSALIESAKDYLSLKDSDLTKTNYLAYLIDQLSILSANHLFYDSTIYKEFFFTDAQMSESVYNLAKWIGYSIPKAVPATLKVMFGVSLNYNSSLTSFTIPPYFYAYAKDIKFIIKSENLDNAESATFHSENDKVKSLISGTIINNSILNVKDYNGFYKPVYLSEDRSKAYFTLEFEQKEIIFQTFQVPSDLTTNQFYNIPVTFDGQVSDLDVYVISPTYGQKLITSGTSVDGTLSANTFDPTEVMYDTARSVCSWTKWEEAVHGVYTMYSKSNQYTWVGGYNKGEIMFGNGILGKQPIPNSIIAVRLHVTKGSQGNIISNTLTYSDPIYATTDNKVTTIDFSVENPNAGFGGSDLLTLPEIKQKAITNLSAKKRLVSEEDYNNLQTILGDNIPLSDAYSILKRSDIKVNEIMTFTTLNYTSNNVSEIVPTRNTVYTIKNPNWDEDGKLTVLRNTLVDKTNSNVGDDNVFETVFNMTLDKKLKTASYDYILQNVKGSSVKMYSKLKDNFYEQFCYMIGSNCNFGIDINKKTILTDDYPLNIRFAVNHVANRNYYIGDDGVTRTDTPTADMIKAQGHIISKFQCKMVTKWGDNTVYDATSTSGYYPETTIDGDNIVTYKAFNWVINNYLSIPNGMQRFEFQIQCWSPYRNYQGDIIGEDGLPIIDSAGNIISGRGSIKAKMTWNNLNVYYCDIIVRRDLSNFMTSSITLNEEENTVTVHNVPVILKSYYDEVIAFEEESYGESYKVEDNFELSVLQTLIDTVYFNNKKMLTDFINLKFADTYGNLVNLRYNQPDYVVESRFWNTPWYDESIEKIDKVDYRYNEDYGSGSETDPKAKPGKTGVYYIVNGPLEELKSQPISSYLGYIALRLVSGDAVVGYTYTYQLFEPKVGMYIKVKDELDTDGYFKTLVWNGKIWKDINDYQIPLEIKMKVEIDSTKISKSDDEIRKDIVSALTEYFSSKIGIQTPVDRSEIVRVCRSIPGIIYVELLSPEFDIKFDYEIRDLNQKQLIDYTPQYVGFRGIDKNESDTSKSSIDIEIIRV